MDVFAHMGYMRRAYKILVENPEGRRSLGMPRLRWEVNRRIVATLKERWRNGVLLIKLATGLEILDELSDYQLLRKDSDLCCYAGSYTGIRMNGPRKLQELLG
jgi:hypothetical protein